MGRTLARPEGAAAAAAAGEGERFVKSGSSQVAGMEGKDWIVLWGATLAASAEALPPP